MNTPPDMLPADHPLAQAVPLFRGQPTTERVRQFAASPDPLRRQIAIDVALADVPYLCLKTAVDHLCETDMSPNGDDGITQMLFVLLCHDTAAVRQLALLHLADRNTTPIADHLSEVIASDPSWTVRKLAVDRHPSSFGSGSHERSPNALVAATDPHWRVRNALLHRALTLAEDASDRRLLIERLETISETPHVRGMIDYLRWRWDDIAPPSTEEPPSRLRQQPWWDDDGAVLARHLQAISEPIQPSAPDPWPLLIGHNHAAVRRLARQHLDDESSNRLADASRWLDDPRTDGAQALRWWLDRVPTATATELVRTLLPEWRTLPAPLTAWLLDRVGETVSVNDLPIEPESLTSREMLSDPYRLSAVLRLSNRTALPLDRRRLVKAAIDSRSSAVRVALWREIANGWQPVIPSDVQIEHARDTVAVRRAMANAIGTGRLARRVIDSLFDDPHPAVRLPTVRERGNDIDDPLPTIRAAGMSNERAEELIANPERIRSWSELETAADRVRRPLWNIVPFDALTDSSPQTSPESQRTKSVIVDDGGVPSELRRRPLGNAGPLVSPLGLSGHYGLPTEGFREGARRGINLFFWEPNYETLNRFFRQLPLGDRSGLHVIAGTFECTADGLRKDVERALKALRIERLSLFLLFWVRSWERIDDGVRDTIERLTTEGKIARHGMSTHQRKLACDALREGWDPVMVRHSGAHRGAEETVFPVARELGRRVITFNNTCYGRMLKSGRVRPRDCYRYSLSFSEVAVCLTAPATLEQLRENLTVLDAPPLPIEERERIANEATDVYRDDRVFGQLIRKPDAVPGFPQPVDFGNG